MAASPRAAAPIPSISRSRIGQARVGRGLADLAAARPHGVRPSPASANIRRSRVSLSLPATDDRYRPRPSRSKRSGATSAARADASRSLLAVGDERQAAIGASGTASPSKVPAAAPSTMPKRSFTRLPATAAARSSRVGPNRRPVETEQQRHISADADVRHDDLDQAVATLDVSEPLSARRTRPGSWPSRDDTTVNARVSRPAAPSAPLPVVAVIVTSCARGQLRERDRVRLERVRVEPSDMQPKAVRVDRERDRRHRLRARSRRLEGRSRAGPTTRYSGAIVASTKNGSPTGIPIDPSPAMRPAPNAEALTCHDVRSSDRCIVTLARPSEPVSTLLNRIQSRKSS